MSEEIKKRAAKLAGFQLEEVHNLPQFLGLPKVEMPKLEIGETFLVRVKPEEGKPRWFVAIFAYDGRFYDGHTPTSYSICEVQELYRLPEEK